MEYLPLQIFKYTAIREILLIWNIQYEFTDLQGSHINRDQEKNNQMLILCNTTETIKHSTPYNVNTYDPPRLFNHTFNKWFRETTLWSICPHCV